MSFWNLWKLYRDGSLINNASLNAAMRVLFQLRAKRVSEACLVLNLNLCLVLCPVHYPVM